MRGPSKRTIRKLEAALRIRGCWAESERLCGLPRGAARRYARTRPALHEARKVGREARAERQRLELEHATRLRLRAELRLREVSRELCRELARFSFGEVEKRLRLVDHLTAELKLRQSQERRAQRRR